MRRFAKTLLILGGVTACERAYPVVDDRERPAVGNIGQTGRPAEAAPAAAAMPVETPTGPAVGNIGQSGAPKTTRRVERAKRAARPLVKAPVVETSAPMAKPAIDVAIEAIALDPGRPAPPEPTLQVQQQAEVTPAYAREPLRNHRERPAAANMGRMAPEPYYSREERLAMQQQRQLQVQAERPLVNQRERPAIANVMSKRKLTRSEQLAHKIRVAQKNIEEAETPEDEAMWRREVALLTHERNVALREEKPR
jgi:hypothetical protein